MGHSHFTERKNYQRLLNSLTPTCRRAHESNRASKSKDDRGWLGFFDFLRLNRIEVGCTFQKCTVRVKYSRAYARHFLHKIHKREL